MTKQETTTAPTTQAAGRSAWRTWWSLTQGLLFTTSLVVVVVLIAAAYELQVGEHAGFGRLAVLVPFVVGPYVIWTWTDPHARWWDEAGAVGLLCASVALSVVDLERAPLKLAVGLVLIVTEWRMVARARDLLRRADDLAGARGRAAELAGQVADLTRQLAAARTELVDAEAVYAADRDRLRGELAAAGTGGTTGGPAAGTRPWGATPKSQTAWLVQQMRAGRTEWTGETVAALMGLRAAKTGRDRLAAARRAFRPVWPVDDTDGEAKEA